MTLEQYLSENISDRINLCKSGLKEARKALRLVEKINLNDANYQVTIVSAWKNDGEETVQVKYKGKLEDAIKNAETEFKKVNKRANIDGSYSVSIILGKTSWAIPNDYYSAYQQK